MAGPPGPEQGAGAQMAPRMTPRAPSDLASVEDRDGTRRDGGGRRNWLGETGRGQLMTQTCRGSKVG